MRSGVVALLRSWCRDRWRRRPGLFILLIVSVIVAVIVSVPFLLFAMLIGSRLMALFFGPVNIWNSTRHAPPAAEIAGHYQLLKTRSANRLLRGTSLLDRARFRLASDHRLQITDLPDFDEHGDLNSCAYNGVGKWQTLGDGMEVTLVLDIEETVPATAGHLPSCGETSLGIFWLLGHSPPYRIWHNIGDPDNEEGPTFVRDNQ